MIDALAEGCASLFMTLALERIVIGGGVMVERPRLIAAIATATAAKCNGFPPFIQATGPVVPAELGNDAGPKGALLLAENTLSDRS